MDILKRVLLVVVLIIATLIIIGFFLPREVTVERSIAINATPASIYEEISDLKKVNKWGPWSKIDPEGTTYTFSGAPAGVGQKMEWRSENPEVRSGSEEIVEAIADQQVRSKIYFEGYDDPSFATLSISLQEGDTSQVSWVLEADMGGNPIRKIMGLFLSGMVGDMYEKGLQNLKERMASKPAFDHVIGVESTGPIRYLAIREQFDSSAEEDVSSKMGQIYGQLMKYIDANGIMGAGIPMSVYNTFDSTLWDADVAIPVADPSVVTDTQVIVGQTSGGKVVKGIHHGDYAKLNQTHKQMMDYIQFNELEMNGRVYEIYATDPMVADTAQWVTEVYYPVKD